MLISSPPTVPETHREQRLSLTANDTTHLSVATTSVLFVGSQRQSCHTHMSRLATHLSGAVVVASAFVCLELIVDGSAQEEVAHIPLWSPVAYINTQAALKRRHSSWSYAESAGVSTLGGGTKDVLSCPHQYTTQMAARPTLASYQHKDVSFTAAGWPGSCGGSGRSKRLSG